MSTTTIYLVRHGESEANVAHIIQGQGGGNSTLTENGKEEVQMLGKQFKEIHFDAIFSSDLLRTIQSAEILSEILHLPVHISPALRERNLGKYEGMKDDEFLKLHGEYENLSGDEKFHHQIGEDEEPYMSGYNRLYSVIQQAVEQYPNKTVLFMTHGGIIRSLLIKNGHSTYTGISGVSNCGYVKIHADSDTITIVETNGVTQ